jgi:hypothetical protein
MRIGIISILLVMVGCGLTNKKLQELGHAFSNDGAIEDESFVDANCYGGGMQIVPCNQQEFVGPLEPPTIIDNPINNIMNHPILEEIRNNKQYVLHDNSSITQYYVNRAILDSDYRLIVYGSIRLEGKTESGFISRYIFSDIMGEYVLDPTFADNGMFIWNSGHKQDRIYAARIFGTQIVFGGRTAKMVSGKGTIFTAFYGTLDSEGNVVGDVKESARFDDKFQYMWTGSIDNSRRYLMGGVFRMTNGYSFDLGVYRLDINGQLDTTFGDDGYYYRDWGGKEYATQIVVNSGALYVIGSDDNNTTSFIVKLTESNGDLVGEITNIGLKMGGGNAKIVGQYMYFAGYTCCVTNGYAWGRMERLDFQVDDEYGIKVYDNNKSRAKDIIVDPFGGTTYVGGWHEDQSGNYSSIVVDSSLENEEIYDDYTFDGSKDLVRSMFFVGNGILVVGSTQIMIDGKRYWRPYISYNSK